MRGTTRRSDLKCSPGLLWLFCLLCNSFPPPHPPGSFQVFSFSLPEATLVPPDASFVFSDIYFHFIFLFTSLPPFHWCNSVPSYWFLFPSFQMTKLISLLLLVLRFFSPSILIVFLLQYFTFLSFSLNKLCNRKARRT